MVLKQISLSILCILTETPLRAHAKGEKKSLNGFKFGSFSGRFLNDCAEIMAMKGLSLVAEKGKNQQWRLKCYSLICPVRPISQQDFRLVTVPISPNSHPLLSHWTTIDSYHFPQWMAVKPLPSNEKCPQGYGELSSCLGHGLISVAKCEEGPSKISGHRYSL